ncbi:MAG: hypothetical protein RLY40_337 [Pseudomonadota bacterium]
MFEKINQIKNIASQLKNVCMDGEAVLAFIEHLFLERNKIEQFFQEKYTVYYFQYKKQKEFTVALHTENISRGNLIEFQQFINRLITEFFAAFDKAHAAGKAKEFFDHLSGLCIEGRMRGCIEWVSNLEELNKFDEIMQKAIQQYEANLEIMELEVRNDMKNPMPTEDEQSDEYDVMQASSFISPRTVGRRCLFQDPNNSTEWFESVINEADVEDYLKNVLCYAEENSFVFLEDPDFSEKFEKIQLSEQDRELFSGQLGQPIGRLNPSIVENLLLAYIEGFVSEKYKIEEGFVNTQGHYQIDSAYKKIYRDDHCPWVVFQVTRDSKKDDGSKNLAFINDVILAFLDKNPGEDSKLLMPMAQCRSQLGVNKKHYVLVEITIHGTNKEIVIHNSQSKHSTFGYLNCLKDLKGFKFNKHNTYSQQKDGFSCGLFVYRYIQSILETGNANCLKDIRASLADPCLNLESLINDNLSRVTNLPQRKIVASVGLSWQRKELEKYLAINYAENLDQEINFPNEGPYANQASFSLNKNSFFSQANVTSIDRADQKMNSFNR